MYLDIERQICSLSGIQSLWLDRYRVSSNGCEYYDILPRSVAFRSTELRVVCLDMTDPRGLRLSGFDTGDRNQDCSQVAAKAQVGRKGKRPRSCGYTTES